MAKVTVSQKKGDENPYIGPRTFSLDEADKFFGRDHEARDLIGMIVSHRTMLFYAQSGAGKSSLINAKLIPGLIHEGFEVLPVGRVSGQNGMNVDVENIFVYNLISSLHQKKEEPPNFSSLTVATFLDNLVCVDGVFAYDDQYTYADNAELKPRILLIDQFEEILTTNTPFWKERELFFQQLCDALALDDQLWVVLAMREDFVAGLDPYRHYFADGLRGRFYMQQLDRESALEAITRPAENGKRPFTPDAADTLVDNLREIRQKEVTEERYLGAYVEPVQLQAVCYQMWEQLKEYPGEKITVDDVVAYADISKALIKFYEDTIADTVAKMGVSEPDLRDWFDANLITEAHTRNAVYRGEETTGGLLTPIADYLESKFIIRENVRPGGIWYELIHDRFVEPVLRANREWRGERPLIQLANRWEMSGRDSTKLLGRLELAEYTSTIGNLATLGVSIVDYVKASQAAIEYEDAVAQEQLREQELGRQREKAAMEHARAKQAELATAIQKKLTKIAAGIGVFAVIASIIAFIMLGIAQKARSVAEEQTEYAEQQADIAIHAQVEAELARANAAQALVTAEADRDLAATSEANAIISQEQSLARVAELVISQATAVSQEAELAESLAIQASLLEQLVAVPSASTPTLLPTSTPNLQGTVTPVFGFTPTAPAFSTPIPTPAPTQDYAAQLAVVYATQTAVAIQSVSATTILLGASQNAVPIEAIRMGSGPNNYLFIGGIHAGMAPGTVSLAEELAAYYEENPTKIPSYATLYFIPSLNPDSPRLPREIAGRLNANGVDINRNWGCAWQKDVSLGGRLYEGAGGSQPFSEPETMALKEFIEQINPNAVVVWDAPSSRGYVSYGTGCDSDTISSQLGTAYAMNTGYGLDQGSPQVTPGDITHWLDQQGIPATFVVMRQATRFDLELHKRGVQAVIALGETPTFERLLYLAQSRMRGDDVQLVQQRLFDLGYSQVGAIDGIYGPNTEQAVKAFQQDMDLDVDGEIGPNAWYVLFSSNMDR